MGQTGLDLFGADAVFGAKNNRPQPGVTLAIGHRQKIGS
jgi:hypothetical protein